MSVRRMLPFLLINIVVSAVVVLAILFWWDGRNAGSEAQATSSAVAIVTAAVELTLPSLPAITSTPEPEEGPPIHVVRAGDTLSSISELYEVPMEDVMTANGISNPNVISVGQQLVIPVGGFAEETPIPSPTEVNPGERPSPIPTAEPLNTGEVVVEITDVTGVSELAEEAVQITNLGSRQIALFNWKLADADGHVYTFGQVTLFGDGAAIQVHTEAGQDGPADLYWGSETPIWEAGERVTLLDAEENIRATFDIP